MKNLNKVLAMLVVFMMVVSTVAFASFTDVAETSSYATAIEVGSDLGLIFGDPDGSFRPEGEITRAEFAAIVVRLLGQEAQAKGAAASTQFADVPADNWAAGYVNIAVQAGVIKGYGNGNFGPNDLVEYQDALTMMVRALGYEPAIGSAGYPTGYLTKAGDLGLTKNVNGTNGVAANRATVAQIAFNALDVPLMTQSGYGTFTQYVINDGYSATTGTANVKKTLLSENHSTVKVMGTILSSTDATSSSVTGTDKVTVNVTNYMYNKFGVGYTESSVWNPQINRYETVIFTDETMEVGSSDALAYVGKKCVLFVEYDEFNDKCTIKSIYEAPTDDAMVIDFADIETLRLLDIIGIDTDNDNVDDEFYYDYALGNGRVKTEDVDVTIAANASIYYNGVNINDVVSTIAPDDLLIKKSGTIELALLGNTTTADYDTVYITAFDAVVVDEVKAGASRVVAKAASDSALNRIEYDETDGDVKAALYDAEGKAMDWADLEENTVLGVKYVEAGKVLIEAQVINNVVTGTVTEVDQTANWGTNLHGINDYKYVWIDGTEYEVLAFAENDKDIKVGDEGTYYLGTSGIVWHEATVSVNTNYAYVISAQNEVGMTEAKIKMVTADGIATYDVNSKIYVSDLDINGVGKGYERSTNKLAVDAVAFDLTTLANTLITFKTDANGAVTAIEKAVAPNLVTDAEDYFTIHASNITTSAYDPDDASFGRYNLTENTVVFDVTDTWDVATSTWVTDSSNWEIVALKNLAEGDVLAGAYLYNVDEDDNVGAIVVTNAANTTISGATNAATFVTGSSQAYDEEGVLVDYVKGFCNGEEVVYAVDGATIPAVGSLVVPEYKANGDVKAFNVVQAGYSKGLPGASNYAVGYSGAATAQNSSKGRISIAGVEHKVPASANVYVYEASSTKRVKYTTGAYIGYVEFDDQNKNGIVDGNEWGWYIDKDNTNLTVDVYAYEYDGDIVDVVYYVH